MHLDRKAVLLCVALLAGGVLMVRGLSRFRPAAPVVHEPPGHAGTPVPVDLAPFRVDTEVRPENLTRVLDRFKGRTAELIAALPPAQRVGDGRSAALAAAAADSLGVVLGGSFDEYAQLVADRGGQHTVDISTPGARAAYASFYEEFAKAYAFGGVGLEGVMVRPRVVGGRVFNQPDFGLPPKSARAPGRYPAVDRIVRSDKAGQTILLGDTYEVLLPITHRGADGDVNVIVGVWLTWVPEEGRWLPSLHAVYPPGEHLELLIPRL